MPICSSGTVVSSSTQLGADVVLTSHIKNGEIVNADLSATAGIAITKISGGAGLVDADINAAAGIVGSKLQALSVGANAGVIPSTGIVNAHLSGSAGITAANLATIATASKVDGAALYNLANIPAGGGVIPAANVPGGSGKCGEGSYNTATASGNFNIAHGLGKTPYFVRVAFLSSLGGTLQVATLEVIYNGTTTTAKGLQGDGTTSLTVTNVKRLNDITVAGRYVDFTVSFDATNIIFAMTKVATPTRVYDFIWEALG